MHGLLAILERFMRVGGRQKAFYIIRSAGVALVALCVMIPLAPALLQEDQTSLKGGWIFETFAQVQLAVLLLCSVILGASTMSREREGRTLGVLLASGFHPVAISGGLALGNWLPLGVGLLAGIPVALLLLILGGTTLEGFLLTYLLTLSATILTVGASSFVSAHSPSTARGMFTSAGLLLFPYILIPVFVPFVALASRSWGDVLTYYCPFVAVAEVTRPMPESGALALQGTVWAATGTLLAIAAATGTRRLEPWKSWGLRRPVMGASWRPLRSDRLAWSQMRRGRGGLPGGLLVWVCLGLALLLGVIGAFTGTASTMTGVAVGLVWLICWLACLFHSLAAFGDWRRDGRLTLLLACPLSAGEILKATFLAVVRSVVPLVGVYVVAAIVGALLTLAEDQWSAASGPLTAVASIAKALASLTLLICLGVCFSLTAMSTIKALLMTLAAFISWKILFSCCLLMAFSARQAGPGFGKEGVYLLLTGYLIVVDLYPSLVVSLILLTRFDGIVGRCP